MRRRASNVYERPVFLARVGAAAFAITLLAFALIARSASPRQGQGAPPALAADTSVLIAMEKRAAAKLGEAEGTLEAARARHRASAVQRDAISPQDRARRDTLVAAVAELTRLLERSDDAPLVASFRALGTTPAMTKEPRVKQLLDSLNDLDKARADFGSSDGVDPIFVALTARVGSVGHELEGLARAKRAAMRKEIESLAPPPLVAVATIDTVPLVNAVDSATRAHAAVAQQLATARIADSVARERSDDASGIFGVGLPILVLAAIVVAIVIALAIALTLELRWPRVADVAEAESLSGARVLVTIGRKVDEPDRQRRSSDREIPPSIEQQSETYRLLYGQLADTTFHLTTIAVAGEHPFVTAAVAGNLAAIAARSGRPTLLLDTDFRVQPVAKMTGVPASPGVADVLAHRLGWAGALSSVLVSRGRSIDVLPSGTLTGTLQAVTEQFSAEVDRLSRRYETVVLNASTPEQGTMTVAAGAVGEVVICLRRGRATHASLRAMLASLEASGARMRGIVLWDREEPVPVEAGWAKRRLELLS
jgi:Mrp family chromosome partitioning ATPase